MTDKLCPYCQEAVRSAKREPYAAITTFEPTIHGYKEEEYAAHPNCVEYSIRLVNEVNAPKESEKVEGA